MSGGLLDKFINQLLIVDFLIGLTAYVLQQSNARFIWIFIISIIVLFLLFLAKVFSVLEAIIHHPRG